MTIRIAHLSDIHFGGEIPEAVEASIEAVAAFAPTLTAVTGDLTLNGLPREFRDVGRWLARFPGPMLVTPGNHDTPYWNLVLRALTPFARYRRYVGAANFSAFDASGLAVRSLSSARGAQPRLDWSKGAMSIVQVRKLDWGHHAAGGVRVFACHHPLIEIEGAPVTGAVHRGAEAVAQLVEEGVELILTGHVHVPFVLPVLADTVCYNVGAGTLSIRTRGTPPSFSTIVADEKTFEITEMAWSGQRFEPARTWSLPRAVR